MYLGLDLGTQGIRAVLLDSASGSIASSAVVSFARCLPLYMSPGGCLTNMDPLVRHADPMMWLDGIDLVLRKLAASGADMAAIRAVSGSAQQHGTVYLNSGFDEMLARLDRHGLLSGQLSPALSRLTAPIWMDRSTSAECKALLERFGGKMAQATGNMPTERFAGPQIMKFARENPDDYNATAHIHLVSSFACSALCGANSPIDFGDGAGMNLLNLHTMDWDPEIAEFTASGLLDRLPGVVPSSSVAGGLSQYFRKYGMKPGIPVVTWSGDNPCGLIGSCAFAAGNCAVSLGTSDTISAPVAGPYPAPDGYGNVFGNPAGGFMGLVCFTNGSHARSRAFAECGVDFDFADNVACQTTMSGNEGKLILPYYAAESTPRVLKPRVVRNYDAAVASPAENIRALFESQALSMRLHAQWLGESFTSLRIMGGASKSAGFRQVIADVFQTAVSSAPDSDAAALGAAMRACEGAGGASFDELHSAFESMSSTVEPNTATASIYDAMLSQYADFESQFLTCE